MVISGEYKDRLLIREIYIDLGTRVRDFMTTELDTVSPDDTLIKAVVIIVEHRRKTLPVVQDGKFLGMVTRRSILEKVAPSLL